MKYRRHDNEFMFRLRQRDYLHALLEKADITPEYLAHELQFNLFKFLRYYEGLAIAPTYLIYAVERLAAMEGVDVSKVPF